MKILLRKLIRTSSYVAFLWLGLSIFSACFAQSISAPSGPPSGPGGSYPSAGAYPGTSWPYITPPLKTTATPTIDQNGAAYLPYLPWMATNIAALVNYSDFFYNQAKNNGGDGSTVPFNWLQTTTTNNLLNQTQNTNMATAAGQTQQNIQQFLSFGSSANTNIFSSLPLIPGTDTDVPCQSGKKCATPSSDSAFNADSLFGVTSFPAVQSDGTPTPQAVSMSQLILFLSNITSSLPDPGLSTDPSTRQAQLNNGQVQAYLLKIRTLAALQSMALSNFNYLVQERKTIPNLGANAAMTVIPTSASNCSNNPPPAPIKDASQFEVDKYLIDRRVNNPCWYANMNSASPLAVARETLYVMVEIQRQLYETKVLNERMLATLSTMQMAMTQMGGGGSTLSLQASNVAACLKDPKQCGVPVSG